MQRRFEFRQLSAVEPCGLHVGSGGMPECRHFSGTEQEPALSLGYRSAHRLRCLHSGHSERGLRRGKLPERTGDLSKTPICRDTGIGWSGHVESDPCFKQQPLRLRVDSRTSGYIGRLREHEQQLRQQSVSQSVARAATAEQIRNPQQGK